MPNRLVFLCVSPAVLVSMLALGCVLSVPVSADSFQKVTSTSEYAIVSPSDLDNDARLNRLVTLDEFGTPVDELLAKLSTQALPLSVDATCAA